MKSVDLFALCRWFPIFWKTLNLSKNESFGAHMMKTPLMEVIHLHDHCRKVLVTSEVPLVSWPCFDVVEFEMQLKTEGMANACLGLSDRI